MERSELTASIVVDNTGKGKNKREDVYRDTPLPFAGSISGQFPRKERAARCNAEAKQGAEAEGSLSAGRGFSAEESHSAGRGSSVEGSLSARRGSSVEQSHSEERNGYFSDVPGQILEMIRLYEFGDGSPEHRARMFCRQGKFMEKYEDDFHWKGDFRRYFTTYHDLNIRQLRGYFTWRTGIRNGEYRPISTSLAYMYLYELLCGIGASSVDDVLQKMETFEKNYVDAGISDPGMRKNIRRWMFEYAVLHGLPAERVRSYANPEALDFDHSLVILKNPENHANEEIFHAMSRFTGQTIEKSAVLTRNRGKGIQLLAGIWRYLSEHFEDNGRDIFTVCFGTRKCYPWHPLSNAVYWEERELPNMDFEMDECRTFHLRDGKCQEERYGGLGLHLDWFRSLLRASDRIIRRELRTGHYLRERKDEQWAVPYIEAALREMEAEEQRAAMPVIEIDYAGLKQIREDAAITRDSLLTDEEIEESREPETDVVQELHSREPESTGGQEMDSAVKMDLSSAEADTEVVVNKIRPSLYLADIEPAVKKMRPSSSDVDTEAVVKKDRPSSGEADGDAGVKTKTGADSMYRRILVMLLDGQPINDVVRESHLMPAVVADAINEAFFDEIGDSVVECDGDEICVVEDYREDIIQALGEISL